MCEPSHSVIQFKDNDDDDQGMSAQGGSYNRNSLLGKLRGYAKKFTDWFHVSRMGLGHSEAIGNVLSESARWHYDSTLTRYEGHWWNRKVTLDGAFNGKDFDREYALEAATNYCRSVCTGNLPLLRQFLETSLIKTERPHAYLEAFLQLFNAKGKGELEKDSKKKMKLDLGKLAYVNVNDPKFRQQMTNFLLGYTRKRHLLVPEWADDKTLWTP